MSKRTLSAVGAVLGSLLLVLGSQQAVVTTSAAWTDQVNFTAPVSSGTWVTPATLEFVSPSTMTSTKTSSGNARQAVSLTIKNTGPITDMVLTVVVSEWGEMRNAAPSFTGPWDLISHVRVSNNIRTFIFDYNGQTPIASGTSTGLSFNHSVQCGPNNGKVHTMSATVTSKSPGAVTTATKEIQTDTTSFSFLCV